MIGSYQEIRGDVISIARKTFAETGKTVVIPHVCNNAGIMGAGVAARLSNEWPSVLPDYETLCENSTYALGKQTRVDVESGITVCNMVAQDGFPTSGKVPLRYSALMACMLELQDDLSHDFNIVAPRFGAGLAGGSWSVIRQLIHEIWVEDGFSVTIAVL